MHGVRETAVQHERNAAGGRTKFVSESRPLLLLLVVEAACLTMVMCAGQWWDAAALVRGSRLEAGGSGGKAGPPHRERFDEGAGVRPAYGAARGAGGEVLRRQMGGRSRNREQRVKRRRITGEIGRAGMCEKPRAGEQNWRHDLRRAAGTRLQPGHPGPLSAAIRGKNLMPERASE